jgi:hypothetical protein
VNKNQLTIVNVNRCPILCRDESNVNTVTKRRSGLQSHLESVHMRACINVWNVICRLVLEPVFDGAFVRFTSGFVLLASDFWQLRKVICGQQ